MKIKMKNGGFARLMHAVFDGKSQLTHWDTRKDNTLAAFWRSGFGQKARKHIKERGAMPSEYKDRFKIQSKMFVTPPRELAA